MDPRATRFHSEYILYPEIDQSCTPDKFISFFCRQIDVQLLNVKQEQSHCTGRGQGKCGGTSKTTYPLQRHANDTIRGDEVHRLDRGIRPLGATPAVALEHGVSKEKESREM